MQMDFLKKAKVVRFRSHHNKYLLADEDEYSVWQSRDGTAKNAKWTVEIIIEKPNTIRLKSCFGKYLTALSTPRIFRMQCNKVLQTMPKTLDSFVEWEPVRDGFRMKLKTFDGQFLRANGCSIPPWRDSVSHGVPRNRSLTQEWLLWDVDIVEMRAEEEQQPMVVAVDNRDNGSNIVDEQQTIVDDNGSSTITDEQDPPPLPAMPLLPLKSSQAQPGSPDEVDLTSPASDHNSPSANKNT